MPLYSPPPASWTHTWPYLLDETCAVTTTFWKVTEAPFVGWFIRTSLMVVGVLLPLPLSESGVVLPGPVEERPQATAPRIEIARVRLRTLGPPLNAVAANTTWL